MLSIRKLLRFGHLKGIIDENEMIKKILTIKDVETDDITHNIIRALIYGMMTVSFFSD